MNGIASVLVQALSHTQDEINPQKEGDYIGKDGLLYCGVCHDKKQFRYPLGDNYKIVPSLCKCKTQERKREEELEKLKQKQKKIQAFKRMGDMADKYKDATFENYIVKKNNEKALKIAKKYTEKFDTMYKENQGLLFYGPVGTGKSYTAACIANELMKQNKTVCFTSFVKILQDTAPGGMNEKEYIAQLNSAELIIIDDLGAERSTDYAFEKVYNVIDSRIKRGKPIILTTNLTMDYMKAPTDIRYARIYDRIFEVCYPVQLSGSSFRLDNGRERIMRMRERLE